jgi:DNA-binding transcriptional MerR regulator
MYTISELVERTGVTRRNIHFYIQQELLPPALGAGLGATYADEHLVRLRAIPQLRRQGKRLDEIRQLFQNASLAHIASLGGVLPEVAPKEETEKGRSGEGEMRIAGEHLVRFRPALGVEVIVDAPLAGAHPELAGALEAFVRQYLASTPARKKGRRS